MTHIKINLWHISGYHGFDDYDGSSDDNINCIIAVDSRFTKTKVIDIMLNQYANDRCVVINADLISDTPVIIGSYEKHKPPVFTQNHG